jgi:hypothetical protein
MNHRGQAAFHVRRAATKQICAFDTWLKLIAPLRGNYIIVTAEIEGSRASPDRREYTRAFPSHTIEAKSVQFVQQGAGAFRVLIPRWIFRWYRDQTLRKIQHPWLGKPFAQSG